MQRLRNTLDTLAALTVLVVGSYAGYGMYTKSKPPTPPKVEIPKDPLPLEGLPTLGQPTAQVGIVEFSDFQCPYCARFALDTFPQVKSQLIDAGKVRFYFANFPLEGIHKYARPAATAAVCAQDFWQAHDLLFNKQSELADTISLVPQRLVFDEIGVGFPPECTKAVDNTIALGKKFHVSGTPHFFVGTIAGNSLQIKSVLSGAVSFDTLAKEIQ